MAKQDESSSFTQRFSNIINRFDGYTRAGFRKGRPMRGGRFFETLLGQLKDLFTRDVTGKDFQELLHSDIRDTFRYFTREIDFAAVSHMPRYKRYPFLAWQIFLALAFRLSPARRITFAVAVLIFFYGFIASLQLPTDWSGPGEYSLRIHLQSPLWMIAAFLFAVLLLLELRDKLDLKGDLSIAREIQFGLVPTLPWEAGGIHILCHMRPANTVGGDYYDYIELDGKKRIGIVIADVSGKGMPAALLMALLQGSLRTLITAGFREQELIGKLNNFLFTNIPLSSLVTLFYGELDVAAGELVYINAGHNAPILLHGPAGMQTLASTALALGIIKDTPYVTERIQLQEGDHLLLYTDGITEAFNQKDEEYGTERLTRFLQDHRHLSQKELVRKLIADVLTFCHYQRPADDMTLMSLVRHS